MDCRSSRQLPTVWLVGFLIASLALILDGVNGQDPLLSIEYPVKSNRSGSCSINNDNCDWNAGVWTVTYNYAVYSCSGNGVTTQPNSFEDSCCTDVYRVPGVCVNGYREDDGHFIQVCVSQESRFNNRSSGVSSQRTLVSSSVTLVSSFDDGLNVVNSSCQPFRSLSLDSFVASATPFGVPDIVSCPEFPVGEAFCDGSSIGVANVARGRRRIPASRDAGYSVMKNFNTKGSCSIHNSNCDWMTGVWNGYLVGQAFSANYLLGRQTLFFPTSPSDVRCAQQPYTAPYSCDIGYSTISGNLIAYCQIGIARVIPVNTSLPLRNGAFLTKEYNFVNSISSLHNGISIADENGGESVCTPMDRFDTDTIIFNPNPTFPYVDCAENNVSPDLDVRCVENGASSVNVAYVVLVRGYGSGGPAAAAAIAEKSEDYVFILSSGSSLTGSFSVIVISFLLHSVFALFWE